MTPTLGLFVLTLASQNWASAASISSFATASVPCFYIVIRHPAEGIDVETGFFTTQSDSGPTSASASCPQYMVDPNPLLPPVEVGTQIDAYGGTAIAEASAEYWQLSAVASAHSNLSTLMAAAMASYTDSIVVTGVPSGIIRFTVTSSGYSRLLPSTIYDNVPMLPGFTLNGSIPASTTVIYQDPDRPFTQTVYFDQPFVSGEVISFGAALNTGNARGKDFEARSQTHSLSISLIAPSGEPLWNAVGITESGALFDVGTPEAGTASLIATGLLGLAVGFARRKRRSSGVNRH